MHLENPFNLYVLFYMKTKISFEFHKIKRKYEFLNLRHQFVHVLLGQCTQFTPHLKLVFRRLLTIFTCVFVSYCKCSGERALVCVRLGSVCHFFFSAPASIHIFSCQVPTPMPTPSNSVYTHRFPLFVIRFQYSRRLADSLTKTTLLRRNKPFVDGSTRPW